MRISVLELNSQSLGRCCLINPFVFSLVPRAIGSKDAQIDFTTQWVSNLFVPRKVISLSNAIVLRSALTLLPTHTSRRDCELGFLSASNFSSGERVIKRFNLMLLLVTTSAVAGKPKEDNMLEQSLAKLFDTPVTCVG